MNAQEYRMLLSKFSHEIRNPVALISSFLQLLLREYPEISSCVYYSRILDNMRLLRELLDDMSHFNNAGGLHKEPADLGHLLREAAASASAVLTSRGILLKQNLQEDLPLLQIDKNKMLQVFYNLFRNAEEAMPQGGVIFFSAWKENHTVCIRVEDSGPSIPAEFLPTLFDPLVTHKKEGTGLGLAICREIICAHGGSICVSGDGTPAFTISLPCESGISAASAGECS